MSTMTSRRRLKADYIRVETEVDVVVVLDTYHKIGSIHQVLNGKSHMVALTEKAMDDLYEALKAREAHKQFLANKYGADA